MDWRHLDKEGQPTWVVAQIGAAELRHRLQTESLSLWDRTMLWGQLVWLDTKSQPPGLANMYAANLIPLKLVDTRAVADTIAETVGGVVDRAKGNGWKITLPHPGGGRDRSPE